MYLFGGKIEDGETAEQGFERELSEELPGLKLPQLQHRSYDWSKQLDEIYGKANDAFSGNVLSFLGFGLDDLVPQEALGKARGKKISYRDWISLTTEDNFYIGAIQLADLASVNIEEGVKKKLFVPAEVLRSLVMVPTDKLAALDELVMRKYQS